MAIATADIHIKIDPQVKREAEHNFSKCGITMSRFINDALRSFNRDFRKNSESVIEAMTPENLRIESHAQLVRILEERISANNPSYSLDEVRDKILNVPTK